MAKCSLFGENQICSKGPKMHNKPIFFFTLKGFPKGEEFPNKNSYVKHLKRHLGGQEVDKWLLQENFHSNLSQNKKRANSLWKPGNRTRANSQTLQIPNQQKKSKYLLMQIKMSLWKYWYFFSDGFGISSHITLIFLHRWLWYFFSDNFDISSQITLIFPLR